MPKPSTLVKLLGPPASDAGAWMPGRKCSSTASAVRMVVSNEADLRRAHKRNGLLCLTIECSGRRICPRGTREE